MKIGDKSEDGALILGAHYFVGLDSSGTASATGGGGQARGAGLSRSVGAFRAIGVPNTQPIGGGGSPTRRPVLR